MTSHIFMVHFLMLLIAASSASAQTIPCTPSNEPGTYATVSVNPAGETIVRNKAGEDGISSVSQGTAAAELELLAWSMVKSPLYLRTPI